MIVTNLDFGLMMIDNVFDNGQEIIDMLNKFDEEAISNEDPSIWEPWQDEGRDPFCYQKRLRGDKELNPNDKYYKYDSFLNSQINQISDKALESYFQKYPFARANLKGRERPNILKYVHGGHLPAHQDHGVSSRALSVLLYLNDDYEGGEITFQVSNVTVKPKAGSVILFPSNFLYVHEISEMKSGVRYSVPAWFHNRYDMLMSDGTE
jgi:Rps23 Pro-64 3,4-dihydroxylase Tpa1-like proline 4-hydroxylase